MQRLVRPFTLHNRVCLPRRTPREPEAVQHCEEFLCYDRIFQQTHVYDGNQVGGHDVFNFLHVI